MHLFSIDAHIYWINYIWLRPLFQIAFCDSAGEKFAFFLQIKVSQYSN